MTVVPTLLLGSNCSIQKPTAHVRVNNTLYVASELGRDTRQGCAVTPPICTGHRATDSKIKTDTFSKGNQTGQYRIKSCTICRRCTTLPGPSLHAAREVHERFGMLSGLLINKNQCYFPLGTQSLERMPLVTRFCYLGIIISTDPTVHVAKNLEPVLVRFENATPHWVKIPLTLWGRVNFFKMLYLPKFL